MRRRVAAFAERVGLALASPRRALAAADGAAAGANDALLLLVLKVVCAETRALVAAGWALAVLGPGPAAASLTTHVSSVIGGDLVLIVGATLVVTIAAGRRRALARDLDLACTAWLPVLAIDVAAALGVALGGVVPATAAAWLRVGALAWMAVLVALAIGVARRRPRPGETAVGARDA